MGGEIRYIDISKGNTRFANFAFIESEGNKLLAKLANENNLHNNVLHPFRDGNGRTLHLFITQLARQNSWQIRWENISANEMVNACIQAYHANSELLAELIFKHLDDFQAT